MMLLPIHIRDLQGEDIASLRGILIENVHAAENPAKIFYYEIEEIIGYMHGEEDIYGRERKFLVAEDSAGSVVGCMAYACPDDDMLYRFPELTRANAVEILNAFVALYAQRMGIGQQLVEEIGKRAKRDGKQYMSVNSGPRYKESGGHGVYTKLFGDPKGFLLDKYGMGRHATVWIALL